MDGKESIHILMLNRRKYFHYMILFRYYSSLFQRIQMNLRLLWAMLVKGIIDFHSIVAVQSYRIFSY